jgi:hypothetical protein
LLNHFFEVAELVLSQGGHAAFEWPKGAKGWLLPELVAFMKRHKLFMAECHGFFWNAKLKRQTNVQALAHRNFVLLDKCRCQHEKGFKHDHAKGSEPPKMAFYPEAMSRTISECFYPDAVFSMPVIANSGDMSLPAPHQQVSMNPT